MTTFTRALDVVPSVWCTMRFQTGQRLVEGVLAEGGTKADPRLDLPSRPVHSGIRCVLRPDLSFDDLQQRRTSGAAGPGLLLGLAEGASLTTVAAGIVILALQVNGLRVSLMTLCIARLSLGGVLPVAPALRPHSRDALIAGANHGLLAAVKCCTTTFVIWAACRHSVLL